MAYEYDRFEREEGGGSFLMGLLAGTVLGAGLGMLFAPKSGSELRSQIGSQIADQTGKLREVADQTYAQASEKVSQIGREVVDRGREVVDRGREAYERARSGSGPIASTGTSGSVPSATPPSTGNAYGA
jgi:gas vesicle protein